MFINKNWKLCIGYTNISFLYDILQVNNCVALPKLLKISAILKSMLIPRDLPKNKFTFKLSKFNIACEGNVIINFRKI